MATGEERFIREERVKSSVKEAEKDLVLKESALEPVPMVTKDLQEGKGIVFSYPAEEIVNNTKGQGQQGEKLMDSAIRANPAMRWRTEQQSRGEVFSGNLQTSESSSSGSGSTGSRLKSFDLNLSGTSSQKFNIRKGIVFSYPAEEIVNNTKGQGQQGEKLMDSAIRANPAMRWRTEQQSRGEVFSGNLQTSESSSSGSGSTGSRLKSFDLNLSGTSSQKFNIRKKPGKNKRNQKQGEKLMDSAIRANPAMRWRTEQQSRGEVFSEV
ncbi:hypothetical protein F2Q69_00058692 [Brassica cretica]|uniref:Uncharacterized protein n=1 Tax=Brassica cretica TaxID=69181 RepID=A0A8S9RLX2_BRACR|nr:hypothetical protein F2Q69_00058692 [Brassica cretica]